MNLESDVYCSWHAEYWLAFIVVERKLSKTSYFVSSLNLFQKHNKNAGTFKGNLIGKVAIDLLTNTGKIIAHRPTSRKTKL